MKECVLDYEVLYHDEMELVDSVIDEILNGLGVERENLAEEYWWVGKTPEFIVVIYRYRMPTWAEHVYILIAIDRQSQRFSFIIL